MLGLFGLIVSALGVVLMFTFGVIMYVEAGDPETAQITYLAVPFGMWFGACLAELMKS